MRGDGPVVFAQVEHDVGVHEIIDPPGRDVVTRDRRPRSEPHEQEPVDLRQLEILQTIAETGSFSACGRRLHVSQSAISRQVILLEEELGEALFLRVGKRVRMTPAAESLVHLGQRVFQDVRETVGGITDRAKELTGTLRDRPAA